MIRRDLKSFGIDAPSKGKLLIILGSKWCKSCKLLSPLLQKYRQNGFLQVKEIDIQSNAKIVRDLNITAVPALFFFQDGVLMDKNLEINGEMIVNDGVMIGSFNQQFIDEIIMEVYS